MVQDVERDEAKFTFSDKEDVHSVSNVLKQCTSPYYAPGSIRAARLLIADTRADLRELPEPVFPLPHPERVKHTKERGECLPVYPVETELN